MFQYLLPKLYILTEILLGAWVWRLAFVPPKPADPNLPAGTAKVPPAWHRTAMMIAGPLIMVSGIVRLMNQPGMFGPPPSWNRQYSADWNVSICFPYNPQLQVGKPSEDQPEVTGLVCEPGRLRVGYVLSWVPVDVDGDVPTNADPEVLENLKGVYEAQGHEILSATVYEFGATPVYDLDVFHPGKKIRARTRMVFVGRMSYTAIATAPDFVGQEADVRRFFDSFRIEPKSLRIEKQPAD